MAEDRRFAETEAHNIILSKLTANSDKLIVIDERQQVVLKRLDKINGTVQDYNSNKHKWDFACSELIENKLEHKNFIGVKLFVTLSTILGLLMIVLNLLQFFKAV